MFRPVVLTRPAGQSRAWAKALRERGFEVYELPLIEIAAAPDPGALATARARLGEYDAALWVSVAAVRAFFAKDAGLNWTAQRLGALKTLAWATGPGTQAALLQQGFAPARVLSPAPEVAQFDSEALWPVVVGTLKSGDKVLLVRGAQADGTEAGRDWLRQQLLQAGVQVEVVAAYQRRAPAFTQVERNRAQTALVRGAVWLFNSSQALAHLPLLLPQANWSTAMALTTHERIAQAAKASGFAQVHHSKAALADVVAALAQCARL